MSAWKHLLFSRTVRFGLAIGGLIPFVLLFRYGHRHSESIKYFRQAPISQETKANEAIHNSTLGFEKIFVVSLPERSDRRDGMTLQAAVSGMSIEFIDGRNGHDIPDKALPNGVDRTKFPPNPLGCWRGHMDAVQRIVRENISTALIMEDDADWDVRLKPSLTDFARGARYIQSIPPNASLFSPYGDDWDVLWIGHCGETFPENDDRVFVIPDDPSVPSPRHIGYPLLAERYANHTRVVHRANGPICLYGYALSQRGAQRMLWGLSVKQLRGFVDNELAGFCSGNTGLDVTCVSSQPTYIRTHRAAGSMTKDSDNVGPEALSKEVRETGETVDVRWSVRMNMEKLLKGETEGFEDQFPD